jgi:peptidyl-prolyl cis-trans isomerase C
MFSPLTFIPLILCLGLSFLWSACDAPVSDDPQFPGFPILAWVDADTIRAEDLREFESGLDPVHRSGQAGLEFHREHLESLIDILLMGNDAVARGLDRDPTVAADLEATRRQEVVEAYIQAAVGRNIRVSEPELIEVFEASPYSMSVLPAHIVLPTLEAAEEAYAEIQSGRSFEEVAKERSLDRSTADRGGALDRYYAYDEVSGQVLANIFDQEVGAVTKPFRTVSGYEIGKVLDRRRVDFERYRTVVQRVAVLSRFKEERSRLVGVLADSLELKVQQDGLRRLSELYERGTREYDLAPVDENMAVYRYAGGQLSLKQGLALLYNMDVRVDDMGHIDAQMRAHVLPDLLLLEAASRAGFGEVEKVRRRIEQEQRKRLLKALWTEQIDSLAADRQEAEGHFQSHPELYRAPHETVMQEILVESEAEALDLARRIREGESMGDLARDHSLRLHSDEYESVYFVRVFEKLIYGAELMQAVAAAPVGQLEGPVRVSRPLRSVLKTGASMEQAYSIFKILERRDERLREFEEPETQRLTFYHAGQEKRRTRLRELVEDLRRDVSGRLRIDGAALERYAENTIATAAH